MITKPAVEELLNKSINRYELVIAVSRRSREIVSGETPEIKTDETSPVTIASLEINKNKCSIIR